MNMLWRIWYRLHCVVGRHLVVFGWTDITPLGGETKTYKTPLHCARCGKEWPNDTLSQQEAETQADELMSKLRIE